MTSPTSPGKPGLSVSPLAVPLPDFGRIAGVQLAVGRAGFYKHERPDLLLMRFDEGTQGAGVFTRHGVGSAPVDWCQQAFEQNGGMVRGLVCNAGCANSFTGVPGDTAARRTAIAAAGVLSVVPETVMLASTGVIGVLLDAAKIEAVLPDLATRLSLDGWAEAAQAIMTTDTFPKGAVAEASIDGKPVRIAGIAKGSGMIAPNMATMLAFIATDAAISSGALDEMLRRIVIDTFNAVTVDGDRSTNDTCLFIATGKALHSPVTDASDPRLAAFKVALRDVLMSLAQQLVRDGEGGDEVCPRQCHPCCERRLCGQNCAHHLRKPTG